MEIKINGDILTINGKKVKFESDIKIAEIFDKLCVILLSPKNCSNNVYALNEKGSIVWYIADIVKTELPVKYEDMWKNGDNAIRIVSHIGMTYEIDVYDKKIISSLFTR